MGVRSESISYTSDFFDQLHIFAVKLLSEGGAYADDTDQETVSSCNLLWGFEDGKRVRERRRGKGRGKGFLVGRERCFLEGEEVRWWGGGGGGEGKGVGKQGDRKGRGRSEIVTERELEEENKRHEQKTRMRMKLLD